MTLVPSLEEKKAQLNAGVLLHLLFALALAKQGGLGGFFCRWQGSLLHSMKCKWGPVTKHVGVSLVSLSEECACAQGWRREAAEEMGPSGWWHPIASRHNATAGGKWTFGLHSCRSC